MSQEIGAACITIALLLEVGAYRRQIKKTIRTKKSSHVSSSGLLMRIAKYAFTLAALYIFKNWVAFGMQIVALIACSVTLYIVAKYKPKGWRLF